MSIPSINKAPEEHSVDPRLSYSVPYSQNEFYGGRVVSPWSWQALKHQAFRPGGTPWGRLEYTIIYCAIGFGIIVGTMIFDRVSELSRQSAQHGMDIVAIQKSKDHEFDAINSHVEKILTSLTNINTKVDSTGTRVDDLSNHQASMAGSINHIQARLQMNEAATSALRAEQRQMMRRLMQQQQQPAPVQPQQQYVQPQQQQQFTQPGQENPNQSKLYFPNNRGVAAKRSSDNNNGLDDPGLQFELGEKLVGIRGVYTEEGDNGVVVWRVPHTVNDKTQYDAVLPIQESSLGVLVYDKTDKHKYILTPTGVWIHGNDKK